MSRARRAQAAMNRNIVPKSSAQIISAMMAKNYMKAMITIKHVIVFWVLMYFVRPGFFLHLPKRAMRQPKKAAMRKGKGKMPISLMVKRTQAVLSSFVFQPSGHAEMQTPSCT